MSGQETRFTHMQSRNEDLSNRECNHCRNPESNWNKVKHKLKQIKISMGFDIQMELPYLIRNLESTSNKVKIKLKLNKN